MYVYVKLLVYTSVHKAALSNESDVQGVDDAGVAGLGVAGNRCV